MQGPLYFDIPNDVEYGIGFSAALTTVCGLGKGDKTSKGQGNKGNRG